MQPTRRRARLVTAIMIALSLAIPAQAVADLVPLYRLYHSSSGVADHLYTTSESEKTSAENDAARPYTYERIEGYVSPSPFAGGVPLYRIFHPTLVSHYYTVDSADRDAKITAGYVDQGVLGYVHSANEPGTVPLARLRQTIATPDHYVLALRASEITALLNGDLGPGWIADGTAGFISPLGLEKPLAHRRTQATAAGVDGGSGAYRRSLRGIRFHGYGPRFELGLHYNSQNATRYPLGRGWSHSFQAAAIEGLAPTGQPATVLIKWGDGSETFFTRTGSTYTPSPGNYDTLTRVDDGVNKGYDLTTKDQTVYRFRQFSLNDPPDPDSPAVLLISVTDRHGNAVTFSRDASSGLLITARDAAQRQLSFSYRADKRLESITDPQLSRTLQFTYDANGRLETYTNARGHVTQLAYRPDGLLASVTHPEGNVAAITYDGSARADSVSGLCGQPLVGFSYDHNASPGTTEMTNGAGIPFAEVDHDVTEYFASVIRDPSAPGSPASMVRSDTANPTLPTQITDLRGHVSSYTYDARGNVLTVTNALGKTATFTYDSRNNLTSAAQFGTPTRKWSLTWNTAKTNLLSVSDPLGHTTVHSHAANGQLISTTDPEGRKWTYGYDGSGNRTSVTDPLGHITTLGYDAAGRLTSTTDALGRTTAFSYDANDNRTSVTDALGHVTTLGYDQNDNLSSISYVRSGVTDTVTYTYDSNGCLQVQTDPNGGTHQYTYDSAGNVSTRTDPNGNVTTYLHDAQGRLTTKTDQGTSRSVTYAYDLNGNLTGMDESYLPGSHTFVYDELDRLTSHTNTFGVVLGYGYDDASNRTSIVYPGVGTVQYGYDLASRLETVTDWTSAVTRYILDDSGETTGVIHANGTVSQYAHDAAGRLRAITHRRSDASVFANHVFTYDAVGNQTAESGTAPLSAPAPSPGSTSYTIDKDNRLVAETPGVTYGYDANGNRTSRAGSGAGTTYTYSYENRLTRISDAGQVIEYVYDGLGNRIAKDVGGIETRYVLDLGGPRSEVLAETDTANTAGAYYVYGAGLVSQITPAADRYTYHFDSRGSTVAMSDAAQSLVNRYAYRAFGTVADQQTSVPNPFTYVGRHGVTEESSGIYFMRARFYDAQAGRFLSKDPIGFGGGDWNLYTYVGSNPTTRVDPLGLSSLRSENPYLTGLTTVASDTVGSASHFFVINPVGVVSFLAELTPTQLEIYEGRRANIENLAGLVAAGDVSLDDANALLLEGAGLRLLWRRHDLRSLLATRVLSLLRGAK